MQATKAIIHLNNLKENLIKIKVHTDGNSLICLAVKADAYGHGAVEVAKTALNAGVTYLAVATVIEAIQLRNAGIEVPLILLSIPLPEAIKDIVKYQLIPFTAGREYLYHLQKVAAEAGSKITVHLIIDTGMGRIGSTPEEAVNECEFIYESKWLTLGGVCTHFSSADSTDKSFTKKQISIFKDVLKKIRNKGINTGLIHAANSGAIVHHPDALFNMIRPGIIAYGYYPSQEQKKIIAVKPVMEFETQIVFLKRVKKGTSISYGMTYRTKEETIIGTIPVGYGDGYSRLLSGKSRVLIKNKLYPVVGTICMDQCMIDLGPESDIQLYEKVTLFGPDKKGPNAEDIARLSGTIPYEVTCSINKRVPRIYISP